jgi:hypothetical protein
MDTRIDPLWRPAPLQHRAEHEHEDQAMPISGQVLKDSPEKTD